MNEKVTIQIAARRLVVDMEGLTPLEINALAQKVSDRVLEMQNHNANVADTSKIALLVALSFAADYDKERAAHDVTKRVIENKTEALSELLRDALKMSGSNG